MTHFTNKFLNAIFLILCILPGSIDAQTLMADINPGSASGLDIYPQLVATNNLLFFAGTDASGDKELYYSDGNVGNATKIDINPSGSSDPGNFQVWNNFVYFTADDGIHGREYWRSNGITTQILETEAGADGIVLYTETALTAVNGDLYFIAETTQHGSELWKIPGGSNPLQVLESQSGSPGLPFISINSYSSVQPWNIYQELRYEPLSNALYWFGGSESIWKYTLGSAAPIQVSGSFQNIYLGLSPIPFAGKLYFAAKSPSETGLNIELWECDGTTIQKAFEINSSLTSGSFPLYLTVAGNRLFFIAYNESTQQNQLAYLEDAGGISFHWDALSATFPGAQGFLYQNPLGYQNGELVAVSNQAYRYETGTQSWVPYHYFRAMPASKDYIQANGRFFFWGFSGFLAQLYSTTGAMGEIPTQISHFSGQCDCPLSPFVSLNGIIYFPAYDQGTGMELYRLDPAQIVSVKDDPNAELGNVQIYPNPFEDKISIHFTYEIKGADIQLFDARGKLIRQIGIASKTQLLDFGPDLLPGVYLLKIQVEGRPVKSQLIMKME